MKLFEIKERVNDGIGVSIRVSYVNPEYIMDICDNYNIDREPFGSKVHVQGGMVTTYYDIRTPKEIADILKTL